MRWLQLALASVLAAVASIVIGAPMALAGGWASPPWTSYHVLSVPARPIPIGYTIHQHGQTPFARQPLGTVVPGVAATEPGGVAALPMPRSLLLSPPCLR